MSTKFSFSISKSGNKNKVVTEALPSNVKKIEEDTDYILSVEDKFISSKVDKVEREALVIPLIQSKRSILLSHPLKHDQPVVPCKVAKKDIDSSEIGTNKSSSKPSIKSSVPQDDITKNAIREILQDAQRHEADIQESVNTNLLIPITNKPKEGINSFLSKKEDGGEDEPVPVDADYNSVSILDFGNALLRGMGWKPGQGIGRHNKDVKPVMVHSRPKGLGLGADASVLKATTEEAKQQADEEKNKLTWIMGAYCQVTSGRNAGLYGEIEGFDGDDGRVFVRLTLTKNVASILRINLKLVTEIEYKKFSKYINKLQADSYKEQDDKRMEQERQKDKQRREEFDRNIYNGDRVDSRNREFKKRKGDSSKKHVESSKASTHQSSRDTSSWLLPRILVRIIDKHFKKGLYYKQKVEVVDMVSRTKCTCKTDSGKLLENLSASMLETVIPREKGDPILVVKGNYRGQEGELLEKDSSRNRVVVLLFQDKECITLGFDDVSQYI